MSMGASIKYVSKKFWIFDPLPIACISQNQGVNFVMKTLIESADFTNV